MHYIIICLSFFFVALLFFFSFSLKQWSRLLFGQCFCSKIAKVRDYKHRPMFIEALILFIHLIIIIIIIVDDHLRRRLDSRWSMLIRIVFTRKWFYNLQNEWRNEWNLRTILFRSISMLHEYGSHIIIII